VLSDAALNGFRAEATSIPETQSAAVFGQLVWHLSEKVDLTTGLRYTYEEKDGSYVQQHIGGTSLDTLPPELAANAAAVRQGFFPHKTFATSFNDSSVPRLATVSHACSDDG